MTDKEIAECLERHHKEARRRFCEGLILGIVMTSVVAVVTVTLGAAFGIYMALPVKEGK